MESSRYKIRVSGRVTGVGYRHSARAKARFLNLRGFVRNEEDGTVYIEAEGKQEVLNEFLSWCRKGPGMGFVESVQVETAPLAGLPEFYVQFNL